MTTPETFNANFENIQHQSTLKQKSDKTFQALPKMPHKREDIAFYTKSLNN